MVKKILEMTYIPKSYAKEICREGLEMDYDKAILLRIPIEDERYIRTVYTSIGIANPSLVLYKSVIRYRPDTEEG